MTTKPKVSILVLTHNAPRYIYTTLKSLRTTREVDFEVVVVDNRSSFPVAVMLLWLRRRGWIDKLWFLNHNSLFAAGNNCAARLAAEDASHYLLLNSDVEVRSPDWLKVLLGNHEGGITSFGVVNKRPIPRVDGYCLLIDSALYRRHGLDESLQWFWSVTKLQAKVLLGGFRVKGFVDHDDFLYHFGGKSGKAYRGAEGMKTDRNEVVSWFQGRRIEMIDRPMRQAGAPALRQREPRASGNRPVRVLRPQPPASAQPKRAKDARH